MFDDCLLESVLRDALTRADLNLAFALRQLICTSKQFYNNYLDIFDQYAESISHILGLAKVSNDFACLVYAHDKIEMIKKIQRDHNLIFWSCQKDYQIRLLLDCYQKRAIQGKLIVDALFLFISKFVTRPFSVNVLPVHSERTNSYRNKKSLLVKRLREIANRSIPGGSMQAYTILFLQICRQEITDRATKDECFLIWLEIFSSWNCFTKILEEDSFLIEASDFINLTTVRGMLQPKIKNSLKSDLRLARLISARLRGNVNFLNILIEEKASSGLKKEIVSALFRRYLCPDEKDLLALKYDPEIHSSLVSIMLERFYLWRKNTVHLPVLVSLLRQHGAVCLSVQLAPVLDQFRLEYNC